MSLVFQRKSLAPIVPTVVHDVDLSIIEINRRAPSILVVVVVVVAVATLTRCEISSDYCAGNSVCIRATGRSVVTRADAQSPWMLLQEEETPTSPPPSLTPLHPRVQRRVKFRPSAPQTRRPVRARDAEASR